MSVDARRTQTSASLAAAEARLKRATEELQTTEVRASQERESSRDRVAQLVSSLGIAEEEVREAAAAAETAADERDEAVRTADHELEALRKEKVPLAVSMV